MKRLFLLPLGLVLFASCKEVGPYIDFGAKAADTSYMAPVETPQQRVVLIEEFTGVTCPTCPPGHVVLKKMDEDNPGRLAIMGIQLIGNAQTRPYDHDGKKTLNDNRTQDGTDLGNGIYGTTSSIPVAGFDRTPQNGVIRPVRTQWANFLPSRLIEPTKANIKLTSAYNSSSKQAIITVRVAYTSSVTNDQLLTVALLENEVVDAQELPAGGAEPVDMNYVHQHVLRDIITAPTGDAMLSNLPTKSAGQVYERTIVYTLPTTVLNPDNCRIVAFVATSDGTVKEVVQAAEVHLK